MPEGFEGNNGDKYANISNFIKTVGFPVAVVCYFLIKDWVFTQHLLEILTKIALALDRIGVTVK